MSQFARNIFIHYNKAIYKRTYLLPLNLPSKLVQRNLCTPVKPIPLSSPSTSPAPRSTPTSSTSSSSSSPSLIFLPSNLVFHVFNKIKKTHIYVLGTSHIHSYSAEHTRKLIQAVKPSSIVLELCEFRIKRFKKDPVTNKYEINPATRTKVSEGRTFKEKLSMLQMILHYSAFRNLGLDIGGEFLAALEEGEKLGSKIVLGDLDGRVTAVHMYSHLRFIMILWDYLFSLIPWTRNWRKQQSIKMMKHLISKDPEYIFDATRHYPLAKEREENIAKAVLDAEGDVVCIVGFGHLHALKLLLKKALS